MGPGAILDELRAGMTPHARLGLHALVIGAMVTVMVAFLLSPQIGGLVGLPGHDLDRPVETKPAAPVHAPLTAAQRRIARAGAVKAVASQLGVREHGGANRGSRIVAYRRAVTGAGESARAAEPWCADFVSWAWKRAGVPIGFNGRGSDYVPELVAWARLTRRWHWARDGYTPRPGDLIVYRGGGSARGHIGMVVGRGGGRIRTIEGNVRDRVVRRTVKAWAPGVTGFIAPV